VRELRFPKELYLGEQVDAALNVFARFGRLERDEDELTWIVRVHAASAAKERRLAGELANYALGATIRARGER